MQKCIVQYRDSNENYNCWCNSDWCSKCNTKENRSYNKCKVTQGGFCTCRLCGEIKMYNKI